MKDLIKALYRFKIKVMWYFNLGYGEISNLASAAKDSAILIGFAVVVFKWVLGVHFVVVLAIVSFLGFVLLGIILKKTGMSDYSTRLGNSINPEIKEILSRVKNIENELGKRTKTRSPMVGNLPKYLRRRTKTVGLRKEDGVEVPRA